MAPGKELLDRLLEARQVRAGVRRQQACGLRLGAGRSLGRKEISQADQSGHDV